MSSLFPVLLLGLAGLLFGGALSLRKQGAGPVAVAVVALLGTASAVAGLLWMF